MYLNLKHPEFDFASELHCLLSCNPLPLSQIAADLGFDSHRALRAHIETLRTRGIDVVTERSEEQGNGFVARIGNTWRYRECRRAAETYFDTVYPRPIGD